MVLTIPAPTLPYSGLHLSLYLLLSSFHPRVLIHRAVVVWEQKVRWFIFFHPTPSRTNTTIPSWPCSALRRREVADFPEVSESVDARTST